MESYWVPFVWFAFVAFFGGTAYKLVTMSMLAKTPAIA